MTGQVPLVLECLGLRALLVVEDADLLFGEPVSDRDGLMSGPAEPIPQGGRPGAPG
jgi:hypothetical protein